MIAEIRSIDELSNIPLEIRQAPFWYPCAGKKGYHGWNTSEGWLPFEEAIKMLGSYSSCHFDEEGNPLVFDNLGLNINPAGIALLDADHVFVKGTSNWVNQEAKEFFEALLKEYPDIYVERSMSGEGLHLPIRPTPDKFDGITNAETNLWCFEEGKDLVDIRNRGKKYFPKVETFYKYHRNIVFTGNLFNDGKRILTGEEADVVLEEVLSHTAGKGVGIILNGSNDLSDTAITQPITPISSAETTTTDVSLDEYERDKVIAIVEKIDCSSLDRQEWFEVTTVLKKYDLYDVWLSWCQTDPERSTDFTDQRENQSTWNSISDADNYSTGVLVNILKSQGSSFSEQDFRRQWIADHADIQSFDINNQDYTENPLTPDNLFGGDTSDMDNADRIFYENGDIIRYNFESKEFLTFKVTFVDPETASIQSGVWLSGNQECIYHRVRKLVVDKLAPQAVDKHDFAVVKSLKNHKKISAAINMLKSKTGYEKSSG